MPGNSETIANLERKLNDLERKGNALVEIINDLRTEDGLPPRPPLGGGGGGGSGMSSSSHSGLSKIKPDTFYGKKLQTAVREFLEMRMAAAGGHTAPATPRDIYDCITRGGYEFDAKTPEIAMVSLRALLRKRTAFFHKLPNGTYGLTSWYPDAKKPKTAPVGDAEDEADDDTERETATPKKDAAVG